MQPSSTILIIPGLRDHVANHWQTLLASKLEKSRPVCAVPPLGRENLNCARRVEAIEQALASIDGPVIAIAHSAGVVMLAHWARHYQCDRIIGALLATPADLDTPLPAGYPAHDALKANGWLPVPRQKLPFRSIVAVSDDDPLALRSRVEELARNWGSECAHLGSVGHLNPGSGYGEWPKAEEFIEQLERR